MKKDIDKEVEICDCCEVHENLLQIVNETIPEENELYDLAELFKVFGDSTRIRILFVLFEAGMMSEKEKSSFLNSDAADRMPIAKAYVLKETKKETERFQI